MGQTKLQVKLTAYTPDPEQAVALAAKTCYSASDLQALSEKISRADQSAFIRRLLSYGHLSAIEHVTFTFAVQGVSRALLAQITRHRIASFSVQSQRYVSKAFSEGTFGYIIPPAIEALGPDAVEEYNRQMRQMQHWYNTWQEKLAASGREGANEDARFVLPNACETRFLLTMNARELLHFFSLRCCMRAQWEIRELAWQMLAQVRQVAPTLFETAGPPCLRGACPEGAKSCGRSQEIKQRHEELA